MVRGCHQLACFVEGFGWCIADNSGPLPVHRGSCFRPMASPASSCPQAVALMVRCRSCLRCRAREPVALTFLSEPGILPVVGIPNHLNPRYTRCAFSRFRGYVTKPKSHSLPSSIYTVRSVWGVMLLRDLALQRAMGKLLALLPLGFVGAVSLTASQQVQDGPLEMTESSEFRAKVRPCPATRQLPSLLLIAAGFLLLCTIHFKFEMCFILSWGEATLLGLCLYLSHVPYIDLTAAAEAAKVSSKVPVEMPVDVPACLVCSLSALAVLMFTGPWHGHSAKGSKPAEVVGFARDERATRHAPQQDGPRYTWTTFSWRQHRVNFYHDERPRQVLPSKAPPQQEPRYARPTFSWHQRHPNNSRTQVEHDPQETYAAAPVLLGRGNYGAVYKQGNHAVRWLHYWWP